jgi:hypothetical protein
MKLPAVLGLGAAACLVATAAALLYVRQFTPHFVHDDIQKIRLDMRARIAANNSEAVVHEVEAIIVSPRRAVGFVDVSLGDIRQTLGFHCDIGTDSWLYICLPDSR